MMVWRVQNRRGQGPYRDNNKDIEVYDWAKRVSRHNNYKHPNPRQDSLLVPIVGDFNEKKWGNYRCGFLNNTQARKWFTTGEFKSMAKFGFHLVQVEAEDDSILLGTSQIIFKPKNKGSK